MQKRASQLIKFFIFYSYIPLGFISLPPFFEPDTVFSLLSILFVLKYHSFITGKLIPEVKTLLYVWTIYTLLKYFLSTFSKQMIGLFPAYNLITPIFLVLLFICIEDQDRLIGIIKYLVNIIVFSIVYGLLIHYIGEPFAGFRVFMGSDPEYYKYIGKGEHLIGLNDFIFTFGYPLAVINIFFLYLYKTSRNWIYILLIIIGFWGQLLNGQRASLGFSALLIAILIYKWYGVKALRVFVVSALIVVLPVFYLTSISETSETTFERSERINEETNYLRIYKQYIGVITVLEYPLTGGDQEYYERLFYNRAGFIPTSVHNSFINTGRYAGVAGWILLFLFLLNIIKIIKKNKIYKTNDLLSSSINTAFAAVTFVALFHNAGVFTAESTTWIVIGFILSIQSIMQKRNSVNFSKD